MTVQKQKCNMCDPSVYVDDDLVDKGDFYIYIEDGKLVYEYNGVYEGGRGRTSINYCPNCGASLIKHK